MAKGKQMSIIGIQNKSASPCAVASWCAAPAKLMAYF
jgi:hypothetical protein